ncbi:MAG: hypothetical protein O3B95_10915, partial [Chloroflexi bacterium]|nr:hypothetical protein [Chloroflexota bacterium]
PDPPVRITVIKPVLQRPLEPEVSIWIIVASVVSLRETLDYGNDWLRPLAVAILAYIPYLIILALISLVT